ncbi:hypothetical protein CDEF62S_04324 [Castellaniella defragrans]
MMVSEPPSSRLRAAPKKLPFRARIQTLRALLHWLGRGCAAQEAAVESPSVAVVPAVPLQCRAPRYAANLRAMVNLSRYSRETLQALRTELDLA